MEDFKAVFAFSQAGSVNAANSLDLIKGFAIMATTTFGVNDASAVKLWAKKVQQEAKFGIDISPLIGEDGDSSILHMQSDLGKTAGDKITVNLFRNLTGAGVTEGTILEGNEESLSNYSDSLYINELAHAVRVKSGATIDPQRVPFDLRKRAYTGLTNWIRQRNSVSFFTQVCGYTGATLSDLDGQTVTLDSRWTGLNAVTAPSANRIIRGNSLTTDQAVNGDSTATFKLSLIDKLVEKAKTVNPMIRPVNVEGSDMYVLYLHPRQVTSLRTDAGNNTWNDIIKFAFMGKGVADNPIFNGALGVYNNVILRESRHVMPGVHSSTGAEQTSTRRAVLLGAQAALIGYGKVAGGDGDSAFKPVEQLFDYERQLGVSMQTVLGLKKTVYNSEDYGTIVCSTYAAAAS